ncbi:MAG: serine/threonine protein kinase [Lachnospiraceae bacterium]
MLELKRGTMIGGTYQVLEPLGKGGQSEVWLVLHKRICSLLALKRIPLRARWPRGELDYARHLDHPGLPRIYDVFEAEGYICIVMEYLEGKTLEQLKQEKGSFSEKELLLWLRQLSEILEYLHSRTPPLIHGDIKPSNLMIGPGGRLVLLDFGACLSLGKEKGSGTGRKSLLPRSSWMKSWSWISAVIFTVPGRLSAS